MERRQTTNRSSYRDLDLHNAINELDNDIRVTLAATDIHLSKTKIDSTPVLGWNKRILLKFAFTHLKTIIPSLTVLWRHKDVWSVLKPRTAFLKIVFIHYAITTNKPDVVHFHGAAWCALSKAIGDKKDFKKILRLHGINGNNPSIPHYKKHQLLERGVRQASLDSVSFVTESVAKMWNTEYGAPSEKQFVVGNGYNSGIFQVVPIDPQSKNFDLITVGALTVNKGQNESAKSSRNTSKKRVSPELSYCRRRRRYVSPGTVAFVELHNLNVEFHSYVSQSQLPRLPSRSSFFILPSQREGFGKVFIESIACGTPAIISKTSPLVQEKGVLSRLNSVIIDGPEPYQIQKTLIDLFPQSKKFNRAEVSDSVSHLSWPILAENYCKHLKELS